MKYTIDQFKKVLKRAFYSIFLGIVNGTYLFINYKRGNERILETAIDKAIPFCKYFIIPYVVWYGYMAFFIAFLCFVDGDKYFRTITNLMAGMLISYLIYHFFPTYVPRPKLYGSDIFTKLVLAIYGQDNPYNCFPSVHVLNTFIVALYVQKSKALGKKMKITSFITAVLIILSTLFIKQHYVPDVISSLAIGIVLYILTNVICAHLNTFKVKAWDK